ncbi:MAG: acyl-CoA dehydrogenase family protein [Hahellaceae bacterium]|nr:acyl-CoA dehydrogenase family protein [Hahellaceae bacterium]
MLLNEEQLMVRDSANGQLSRLAPISAYRLWLNTDARSHDKFIWAGFTEMGWPAMLIPESMGGVGLGPVEAGLIAQEMGQRLVVSPFLSSAVLATIALLESSNDEIKLPLLSKMSTGESTVAFACQNGALHAAHSPFVDADVVSDANGLRISCKAGYVLDALAADAIIVPVHSKNKPMLVVVDKSLDGVTLSPTRLVDARPADNLELNRVEIQPTAILARGVEAREILERVLSCGRAILASEMLGTLILLEQRSSDSARIAAAAKAKAGDVAVLVAQECLQMHGGIGMTEEHDIGLFLKHIRVSSFLLGTSRQMRSLFADLTGY